MFQNQPLLKKKRRNSQGYSIGAERVSRFRLRCDEETFPSTDFEESFTEPEPIEREDYETGNVIEELEKEEARYLKCFDKDESLVSSAMIKMARLSRKARRGAVDEIIKMLISPEFPMEQLKSKCRSLADCLMKEDSVFKATFFDRGFQKVIVRDEENLVQCDLYLKSPIRVLSDQISGASKYACLFNTKSSYDQTESYAHPMDSQLGIRGERAIMNAIMSSKEDGVIWHNQEHSMETSFAGMIQLYSDKSSTTLKQSSFQFYPMHATMLNFSEQYRRHCIVHGMSVVAFLPVKFFSNENGNLIEKNLSRAHYLSMLRRCMELVLRELKEVGFPGFQCRDLEGTPRICHPVIASYCCDLPECHDILPIKNGNSSKRNCHRCNAFTQEFNTYTNHEKRTGVRTISILQSLRKLRNAGKNKDCEELMNEHSLIDFIPFLATFPFIGIDPVLDFHIIFSFEPLHNLHLGISRLLKSCLSERLRSMSAQSSRNAGNERIVPLRFSRLKILMGINRFLSHVQRYSPMNGARVDFSKGGSSGSEKGLYGPDGKLIGMLEGKDLRNVDMIFPFVGALLDRTCNEVESALSTKLFVTYVEIVQESLS